MRYQSRNCTMETKSTQLSIGQYRSYRRSLLRILGQTLAATSILVAILLSLGIGGIGFGGAFLVVSMISSTAAVGARAVSLAPALERLQDGFVVDTARIVGPLRHDIAAVTSYEITGSFETRSSSSSQARRTGRTSSSVSVRSSTSTRTPSIRTCDWRQVTTDRLHPSRHTQHSQPPEIENKRQP